MVYQADIRLNQPQNSRDARQAALSAYQPSLWGGCYSVMDRSINHISDNSSLRKLTLAGLLVTLGIVFGDIGTSPLYVMKAIVSVNPHFDAEYIIGAVSCVIWTLTLQTTVKYVLLALRADNNGEGGILALFSLLKNRYGKKLWIIAAIGAAALIADGVITPAITVTSAIEGLRIVVPEVPITPIAILIIIFIFIVQQMGTGKIGKFFGPFMLAWFLMLGVLGIFNIFHFPAIFKAFNPWWAIKLLWNYPGWFLILGAVFLCTTGAEALYSDLGHCGRKNISVSWIFVKMMLILNYLGQGAWLLGNSSRTENSNPFYSIMPDWLMIPGVIMSTGAAIIASQALLSGSFTIFSEAMNLNLWPKLKIKYPSIEKGQLYIPAVNWSLLAGCLLTVIIFRDSSHMEAAYGLAITVTMLMTTVLLTFYMLSLNINKILCVAFILFFSTIEGLFFVANLFKFSHGGWFSILIAGIVAAIMVIWYKAIILRNSYVDYRDLSCYVDCIMDIRSDKEIPKYASNLVYLIETEEPDKIESKVIYSIINKQPKRADHYWFIHIRHDDSPETLSYSVNIIEPGAIYRITMYIGFRVEPKVNVYLRQIIEDLVSGGYIDLRSEYPSLRKRNITGDFRFIMIRRIFSPSSNCRKLARFIMRTHQRLRWLGISDQEAFGLDTSMVTAETVPLIINNTPGRRISRTSLSFISHIARKEN